MILKKTPSQRRIGASPVHGVVIAEERIEQFPVEDPG